MGRDLGLMTNNQLTSSSPGSVVTKSDTATLGRTNKGGLTRRWKVTVLHAGKMAAGAPQLVPGARGGRFEAIEEVLMAQPCQLPMNL